MKTIRNSFLLLFICTISAYSQQNDFQSWSSIKISKKIYKRTNISVKEGIRFRENSSLISKNFTDIKISLYVPLTMLIEDIFKALADTTRLRIARLLGTMELAVGELAQVLGQRSPKVIRVSLSSTLRDTIR